MDSLDIREELINKVKARLLLGADRSHDVKPCHVETKPWSVDQCAFAKRQHDITHAVDIVLTEMRHIHEQPLSTSNISQTVCNTP